MLIRFSTELVEEVSLLYVPRRNAATGKIDRDFEVDLIGSIPGSGLTGTFMDLLNTTTTGLEKIIIPMPWKILPSWKELTGENCLPGASSSPGQSSALHRIQPCLWGPIFSMAVKKRNTVVS